MSGQILTPLAGDLAGDADRGRIVGTVVSGILIGILVSRTISGLVADAAGLAGDLRAAAVARRRCSRSCSTARSRPLAPQTRMPLPARSSPRSARSSCAERAVRWTLVLAATGFATFTLFWTALTFLLSGPPFGYPVRPSGCSGSPASPAPSRPARRPSARPRLVAAGHRRGWALALLAFVVAAFAGRSVVLIIVAIVMLDVALQALNILNQARLFALVPRGPQPAEHRLRHGNFIGGAIGSAAASVLWSAGGWTAVTLAGAALCRFALAVWAAGRRSALVLPRPEPATS